MKLNKQHIFSSIYGLALLGLTIFPSVELTLIICVILITSFSISNGYVDKYQINLVSLLFLIVLVGLFSTIFGSNKNIDILKDVLHYVKPLLMLLAGYLAARKIGDKHFVIKTILFVALVSAIKHIITFIFLVDFSDFDINKLRYNAGLGTFIELLALIILVASKKYRIFDVYKKKGVKRILLFIFIGSFILYFSRTMLLGLVVILITVFGYTKLNIKGVKYVSGVLIVIALSYTVLFNIKLNPDKPGLESFFYKIRNAPLEMFSSPEGYDPQNHKRIFDRWRAYEAKMALQQMNENRLNYLFGKGFGSLIDLKFVAPLNDEGMRFIPIIHNGYIYVLFKTGIIGLFIYMIFLVSLYFQSYKESFSIDELALRNLISGFGVYYLVTSFVITGIYNLEEPSSFILGSFLFLLTNIRKESSLKY